MNRRTALGLIAIPWVATGCSSRTSRAESSRAGRLEFDVHDLDGRLLTWAEFRARQSNGAGEDGYGDVLVDRSTLRVVTPWPLEPGTGTFALERPEGDIALALAWPTGDGYGQLLLDLPAPGRHDFGELAARQAATELDRQLRDRPGYAPSPEVAGVLAAARGALDSGGFVRAHDELVRGQLLVQEEFGRGRARTGSPVVGVTFDDPGRRDALAPARELAGSGTPWVRFVFDLTEGPQAYAEDVAAARAAGVHVLGQFLDSSQLAQVDVPRWRARVQAYVAGLPDVEWWEVGNEVNGAWTGSDVAVKTLWAARHVRENSSARTLVTFYWQLGEGEPEESLFTWAAEHLPDEALDDVDDLGLSVYPQEHPLGASLERVLRTLRAAYPGKRLLISELGYGAPDLQELWWWGARDDLRAGRAAVARFYAAACQGAADGGTFWWYFLQDGPDVNSAVGRELAGPTGRTPAPNGAQGVAVRRERSPRGSGRTP